MFDQQPTLELLFQQLGLSSEAADIEQFIAENQLSEGEMMHLAAFWTDSQRELLSSHWQKDDEWAIVVDTLNELLNHENKKSH